MTSTISAHLTHLVEECDDCFKYALHVAATEEQSTPQPTHRPFDTPSVHAQPVLGAEDTLHDGIALGRRLQREDDDSSFAQYRLRLQRLERAEAERDGLRQYRFRAEAMEHELALVKDQLLAAQMAYDDLAQMLYTGSRGSRCPQCDSTVQSSSVAGDDDDASDGGSVSSPSPAPISHPDRPPAEAFGEVWEDINDFPDVENIKKHLEVSLSLEDSDEDAFLLEQLQALDPHDLDAFWADYRHEHETLNDRLHIHEQSTHESETKTIPQPLPSTSYSAIHHTELSIAQIAELIEEADADLEGDAAQIINLLYEDAEQTAKDDRTPAQVFMLLSWTPPRLEDDIGETVPLLTDKGKAKADMPIGQPSLRLLPSQPQVSALSPLRHKHPEIFVDACPHGIGLIYGTQWLAWKFTPGHPAIPGTSPTKSRPHAQMNMSWAELIAAELGIRTAIALGLRDCALVLRSDNGGVVKALKEGAWTRRWGLDVILARVLRLCESAGLQVVPVWVWGKMNPADAPSRGVYPPRERMIAETPIVPPYLTGLISLVCPET